MEPDHQRIADLNQRYAALSVGERLRQIYCDFDADKILVTSSFAATSAYFLHLVARVCPQQAIHFVDTGFHFAETLHHRRQLAELLGLTVVSVRSEEWKFRFTVDDQTYLRDPDFCCLVNKVEPLEAIKPNFQLWMSSLMRWQTDHRAALPMFEWRRGIIKFNPLIDVTQQEQDRHIRDYQLPVHPLVERGYSSIGCIHCTAPGSGRTGRWSGKPKVECGLHL